MKVSRNDPCPCQSGKKYKKCCGAPQESILPNFTENYFQYKLGNQSFTPYSLMLTQMMHPEMDRMAFQEAQRLAPTDSVLFEQIRLLKTPRDVLDFKKQPNSNSSINSLLLDRLLEHPQATCLEIEKDMPSVLRDGVFEFLVKALYFCGFKNTGLIRSWIENKNGKPYQQAMLGLLLGCVGEPDDTPFLWLWSESLRIQYPKETYWQGPLMGVRELMAKSKP